METSQTARTIRGSSARRWPRRLLIGAIVAVALMLVATAGTYGYVRYKLAQIPRIEGLESVLRSPPSETALNILFVGSDSRAGISDEEADAFGRDQVPGQRADTLIVMRIDTRTSETRMLSIPRDLWVPVHGTGTNGRINAAYGGGPQRLVGTVTEALGIPIDHYLEMDFNGFRGLVDAAGGVDMHVALPARDHVSGLNIPEAGRVTFDGNTALSWVRSRAYEEQSADGTWRRDPRADHGRIERQQIFIRQLMHGLAAQAGGFNVFAMSRMLQTAVDDVRIDSELHSRLIAVARRFRSIEPDAIEMATVPTVGARVSGQAVLKLNEPDARPVLDHFAT